MILRRKNSRKARGDKGVFNPFHVLRFCPREGASCLDHQQNVSEHDGNR
jgi:hypothetical protein